MELEWRRGFMKGFTEKTCYLFVGFIFKHSTLERPSSEHVSQGDAGSRDEQTIGRLDYTTKTRRHSAYHYSYWVLIYVPLT